MHGVEEASASQIRQPWRVIAIGAVGQRPRVFLMCAWVRPLVRVPRGAGACGEGDRGAPASVDATTSTRTSSSTSNRDPQTLRAGGRVLFKESRILKRKVSGGPG